MEQVKKILENKNISVSVSVLDYSKGEIKPAKDTFCGTIVSSDVDKLSKEIVSALYSEPQVVSKPEQMKEQMQVAADFGYSKALTEIRQYCIDKRRELTAEIGHTQLTKPHENQSIINFGAKKKAYQTVIDKINGCPACIPVPSTPAKPKIVCLCGSTKFSEAFRTAQFNETMAGKIVLTIGCNMKSDDDLFGNMAEPLKESIKHQLDELHLRKIEMADEVLILNIGSYIGESTRRELEYARKLRKVIRFAEPVGAPNIRDPEGICDGFEPIGTVYGKDCQGDCETDGHYMCAQCVHREPFKSLEEQDEREQV